MKQLQTRTKLGSITVPLFISSILIALLSLPQLLLAATDLGDDPQFQRGIKTFARIIYG